MINANKIYVSVVVSVFNEEKVIGEFWKILKNELVHLPHVTATIIWVNDGSRDQSRAIIENIIKERIENINFVSIEFSKNYGHEAAMIAGIDHSNTDAIICMDADLQHPPSVIKDMIHAYLDGNEIVTMVRSKRYDNGFFMNFYSRIFYKIINSISNLKILENASDFFLISKNIAEILKLNYRERNRFLRGYIQNIGFTSKLIQYEAKARFAGSSSYSIRKLLRLAGVAVFSFSNRPLHFSLIVSIIFSIFTVSILLFSVIVYFFGQKPPGGYTTLIVFQSICFTILFILIGILSVYFGKIIEEIRERPIYIAKSIKKS